jgi:hypothetical protein
MQVFVGVTVQFGIGAGVQLGIVTVPEPWQVAN